MNSKLIRWCRRHKAIAALLIAIPLTAPYAILLIIATVWRLPPLGLISFTICAAWWVVIARRIMCALVRAVARQALEDRRNGVA